MSTKTEKKVLQRSFSSSSFPSSTGGIASSSSSSSTIPKVNCSPSWYLFKSSSLQTSSTPGYLNSTANSSNNINDHYSKSHARAAALNSSLPNFSYSPISNVIPLSSSNHEVRRPSLTSTLSEDFDKLFASSSKPAVNLHSYANAPSCLTTSNPKSPHKLLNKRPKFDRTRRRTLQDFHVSSVRLSEESDLEQSNYSPPVSSTLTPSTYQHYLSQSASGTEAASTPRHMNMGCMTSRRNSNWTDEKDSMITLSSLRSTHSTSSLHDGKDGIQTTDKGRDYTNQRSTSTLTSFTSLQQYPNSKTSMTACKSLYGLSSAFSACSQNDLPLYESSSNQEIKKPISPYVRARMQNANLRTELSSTFNSEECTISNNGSQIMKEERSAVAPPVYQPAMMSGVSSGRRRHDPRFRSLINPPDAWTLAEPEDDYLERSFFASSFDDKRRQQMPSLRSANKGNRLAYSHSFDVAFPLADERQITLQSAACSAQSGSTFRPVDAGKSTSLTSAGSNDKESCQDVNKEEKRRVDVQLLSCPLSLVPPINPEDIESHRKGKIIRSRSPPRESLSFVHLGRFYLLHHLFDIRVCWCFE
jgi:hypothetical protein